MRAAPRLLRWLIALAPLVVIARRVADSPGEIAVAAMFPAMCYVALLVWVGRVSGTAVDRYAALFAAVWGAGVAAPAAGLVNDLLAARLGAGGWPQTVLAAPAVEEVAKAGVLLALVVLWPAELRGFRAGVLLGAIVGCGFAAMENIHYYLLAGVGEGSAGLTRAIALRGLLQSPVHPLLAAITGAGIGLARATPAASVRPAVAGFAAAVAQHALWNGAAAPIVSAVLCNGIGPSGACRGDPGSAALATVPLVVGVALLPGVVLLAVVARRERAVAAG